MFSNFLNQALGGGGGGGGHGSGGGGGGDLLGNVLGGLASNLLSGGGQQGGHQGGQQGGYGPPPGYGGQGGYGPPPGYGGQGGFGGYGPPQPNAGSGDPLDEIASLIGGGGGAPPPAPTGLHGHRPGLNVKNLLGEFVEGGTRAVMKGFTSQLKAGIKDQMKSLLSHPDLQDFRGKYRFRTRCLKKDQNPNRATFKLGEKGSGIRARGEVQDYAKIKAECLANGTLFEDPEFHALDSSIFYSRSPPKPFEWKRPHELVDDPKFFVGGASRFDVKQGELGDCWLLAAAANLTLNDKLFKTVVPDGQSFEEDYAGIFHFRFWQYGRWVDVVVDDRLPTYYGRLVFLHSEEKNEFWSALLEKAYAKLHGSYEALKGGTTVEAMEDFTGGVTEMYDLAEAPPNLFNIMQKAYERASLMGCSIDPDPNVVEAEMSNGLIKGHAYSVTKVCHVNIQTPRVSGKIPMVRIRNPWGNEAEWKGAWGDSSPEWQFISAEQREEIGLTFETDGEFWMSFKDFMKNFMRLEICNLNPDSLEEEDEPETDDKKKWEMSVYEGAWVRGSSAGGCRNYIDTFWYNPQYRITLMDPDDDDDEEKCSVLIALMQKNRRSQRKLGLECLTIGFAIYHLSDPDGVPKPLDLNFFRYNASVGRSPSFINLREVSCRFKLPPGTYCIVPSTFEANEEGEFLLRVFSEHQNNMEEHDDSVGITEISDEDKKDAGPQPGPRRPPRRVREENEKPEETELDKAVKGFFKKVAGEDLEIDWNELQDVLNYALKKEFQFEGFSKDVCRSMIAMLDVDRSGKLGLEEFKGLWVTIRMWKNVFKMYDHDNSGSLNTFELRRALNSAGYHLNANILNALVLRYGSKDGRITFDDFVMCAVKLKTMIESFNDKVATGEKKAEFSLEEWVELTMYS